MNIFEKRPFSLILCITLLAFSLFIDAPFILRLIALGATLVLIIFIFIFKDLFDGRRTFAIIACVASILAVLLSTVFHYSINLYEYYDKESTIIGVATKVKQTAYNSYLVSLNTESIDDKRVVAKVLFFASTDDFSEIEEGDKLSITATIKQFEASGSFNERNYYYSKGYHFQLYDIKYINIVGINYDTNISFFEILQDKLSQKLIDFTNDTTGVFLAALILGDTDRLDPHTKLSFTITGISHILALSGMHLVIICEGLKFILRLLKMNKKSVAIASTIFVLLYMLVTGCSPSIVRAAVMLTINNLLFLIAETRDIYTTLPLAVLIILIFDPRAVFDMSLWLSAFATLGIVFFSAITKNNETSENPIIKLLQNMSTEILASLFAIGATLLFTIESFTTTSILAPITTLVFSIPCNILIYLGLIVLLIPFNTPISALLTALSSIIRWLVDSVSMWEWSIVSTEYTSVKVLAYVFCVAFFLLLIVKIKNKSIMAAILSVLIAIPFGLGTVLTNLERTEESTKYFSTFYGDNTIIRDNGEVCLIFSGEASPSTAGTSTSYFTEEKVAYIEKLILPNYQPGTTDYVRKFVSTIKTEVVYLPTPKNENELNSSLSIASELSKTGTRLKLLNDYETINIGTIKYEPIMRSLEAPLANNECIFRLHTNEKVYTYLTFGAMTEFGYLATDIFRESKYIIFGSYGNNYEGDDLKIISDTVEEIYCSNKFLISEYAEAYYKNKGVPIHVIGTLSL